jgi:hypothetical protein
MQIMMFSPYLGFNKSFARGRFTWFSGGASTSHEHDRSGRSAVLAREIL